MYLAYAKKIRFCVWKIDNNVKKIDNSTLIMFNIVIVAFLVNYKDKN